MKLLTCILIVLGFSAGAAVTATPLLARARSTDDLMIALLWLVCCVAWAAWGGLACADVWRDEPC